MDLYRYEEGSLIMGLFKLSYSVLARDSTGFQTIIEFVPPRFPFYKTRCTERSEIDGCCIPLSNEFRKAFAYSRTCFKRGTTVACHAKQSLIRFQMTNDCPCIRPLH